MATPYVVSEIHATDSVRLAEIGRLRLEVWRSETTVDESQFPRDVWIEPLDALARHWVACDDDGLVAAARLTIHAELDDNPDGYLWRRAKLDVPTPAAHLCKLVVHQRARGLGLGRILNEVRIEAAREGSKEHPCDRIGSERTALVPARIHRHRHPRNLLQPTGIPVLRHSTDPIGAQPSVVAPRASAKTATRTRFTQGVRKNTHDRLVREIANGTGAAVVFVRYTPSPEAV